MNYFKEAEKVLYHRKALEDALANLERRLGRIVSQSIPSEVTAANYSKDYISSGQVNDTLNECIDVVQTKFMIEDTRIEIQEIDKVLSQLVPEFKEILELWYIEGLSKEKICEQVDRYSTKTIYSKRNAAVEKFAVLYFGAPALKAM